MIYYNTVNSTLRFEVFYRDKTKHNLIKHEITPYESFPYNMMQPFRNPEKNLMKII